MSTAWWAQTIFFIVATIAFGCCFAWNTALHHQLANTIRLVVAAGKTLVAIEQVQTAQWREIHAMHTRMAQLEAGLGLAPRGEDPLTAEDTEPPGDRWDEMDEALLKFRTQLERIETSHREQRPEPGE